MLSLTFDARLEEAMGPFPPMLDQPPEWHIVSEEQCDGFRRVAITYATDQGMATPAYLLISDTCDAENPAPAALALHSTELHLGSKIVVGLGNGGRPNRDYAISLVKKGFVVLAPSYPTMGGYDVDFDDLGYRSGVMKAVWDNVRGLDLLYALPWVARECPVAVMGHSLGGHNALFTSLFDRRIRNIAVSCSFDSFRHYRGGDLSAWLQTRYMPHLIHDGKPAFDFDEVLTALADRDIFISAPLGDDNFSWESVRGIVDQVGPKFSQHGGRLEVVHPDCDHHFPDEILKQATDFLATGQP